MTDRCNYQPRPGPRPSFAMRYRVGAFLAVAWLTLGVSLWLWG